MSIRRLRGPLLALLVLLAVLFVHFSWVTYFSAASRWASLDGGTISPLRRYFEARDYWLGLSYALSLAFAAVAFRRYREQRMCATPTLAIGSLSLSGGLALAACFLVGCCGSPMLAVYISLFGAVFLPIAKVGIFAITLSSVAVGWFILARHSRELPRSECCAEGCASPESDTAHSR